jgi:hypothetical protein
MEEKKSYSPEEVAEMAQAYFRVQGGFGGPVFSNVIQQYEDTVPENVREILNSRNHLEYLARKEDLLRNARQSFLQVLENLLESKTI